MVVKENGASVGQPWTAFGPVWVGDKQLKNNVSREASSKNRTSLPQPSAPIGPHPQPSAPCGWVSRYRTGLPPQTPPDFYSSKVDVVGAVGVVLTRRRESADQ